MEYSTCKDQVITYCNSLASFKANIGKHSKSIDGISLGPVPLLHTRTLMTLFTFRSPFFFSQIIIIIIIYLFIMIFIIVMHVPLFCILVAEILFSSSLDSMYCNILTCLLHTAVHLVSIFGNFRLLCYFFNIV